MHDIKWCGLYGKNSDRLYAATHAQLLTESTQEQKHNERNEGQMPELRKLQDGARYVLKE